MAVRPFRWSLQKVNADAMRLSEAVNAFLPTHVMQHHLARDLRQVLSKHLGQDVTLNLDTATTTRLAAWIDALPPQCLVAVIGMHPLKQKLLLRFDAHLAARWAERLLGGVGLQDTAEMELQPPTETEQGVLQYLLLQCLSAIHTACGSAERVHFRFERFCDRADELALVAPADDLCGIFSWRCGCGEAQGFVECVFPSVFVQAAMATPLPRPQDHAREETRYLTDRLRRYDWLRTTLWVEGGVSELRADELLGLEAGDVVLFDRCDLTRVGKQMQGEVVVRIGTGREAGLRGTIVAAEGLSVRISGRD